MLQKLLDKYKGQLCYITEKLDGSSITCYLHNGEFGVCSRNINLKESEDNAFWKVARNLDIETKLRSLGKNIAIQGELIGEGIQGNKYKLKGQTAMWFNVFDIDNYEYYGYEPFKYTIVYQLGLRTVPILKQCLLTDSIDTLVEMSKGKSLLNTSVNREGIVVRPMVERADVIVGSVFSSNGRVSFKVINPEFLLKYGE